MMKNLLSLFLFLALLSEVSAQVSRTIVVEHFTNSRCGICANRNPGFYSNLANQEGVLHISIHPSAPYNNCIFHQHNTVENDGRTNYYGVYGGTPRLVINGVVISGGTNYSDPAIFDPYENVMTNVSVQIYQTKVDNMLNASVVIKAEADNNYGSAKLFLAAVEESIDYNAPNGENPHHDVFRKTLDGGAEGIAVDVPATAGDSIVITASTAADGEWVFDDIYVMAILQSASTKAVLQADASNPSDNMPLVSGTGEPNTIEVSVFPNPVEEQLTVNVAGVSEATAQLYNLNGQLLQKKVFRQHTTLEVASLPAGSYWLEVINAEGSYRQQVIVQ